MCLGPYASHMNPNARKKILCKHKIIFPALWPHRLAARTPGFHPGNRSSILREVTSRKIQIKGRYKIASFFVWCDSYLLNSSILRGL